MIERLYVHNYRCFENFSLDLAGRSSALIIGSNGSGKSTLRQAIGVFQRICRGSNRVRDLVSGSDFTQHRKEIPIRLEVELRLDEKRFKYTIAFEFPENFREARVLEEGLTVDGVHKFSRTHAQVQLSGGPEFGLDWHVAALPVINERPGEGAIERLKQFFSSMILISPIPANMSGFSEEESTELSQDAGNFASWFNFLLIRHPAAYQHLYTFLKERLSDLESFENVARGEHGRQLRVRFEREASSFSTDFKDLSDGEKCFFLCALILSAQKATGPVFCMWDEPDNHLSLPEISHFVMELRKQMKARGGQFIATSHHPETIRTFSDENTIIFKRTSHLEPTTARSLDEVPYRGDLVEALIRDVICG